MLGRLYLKLLKQLIFPLCLLLKLHFNPLPFNFELRGSTQFVHDEYFVNLPYSEPLSANHLQIMTIDFLTALFLAEKLPQRFFHPPAATVFAREINDVTMATSGDITQITS
jgi:hypothetical protein